MGVYGNAEVKLHKHFNGLEDIQNLAKVWLLFVSEQVIHLEQSTEQTCLLCGIVNSDFHQRFQT